MTREEWVAKCQHWKAKWPVMQPEYLDDSNGINIHAVLEYLYKHTPDDAVIMCDAGTPGFLIPQSYKFKKGQRLVMSQSQGDMGWAIPASVGVSKAGAENVIVIVGDGSFMSNMQELATIVAHNLPIKIIILNNSGYLTIKNTQSRFYGNVYGVNVDTGVWFPDFLEIAEAFRIHATKISSIEVMDKHFPSIFGKRCPAIVDVLCLETQQMFPAQSFKDGKQAPLHDMVPFLSDEEMKQELLI